MEEIRAAICEDEIGIRDYLESELHKAFAEKQVTLLTQTYDSGEELLVDFRPETPAQIYFMDIEMPGRSGIDICREIVSLAPAALIVFISNKEELVFKSLEVRPFRFVRKNHFQEEAEPLVRDILRELHSRRPSCISIQEQNSPRIVSVNVGELQYVEVFLKHCTLHTARETISVKVSLAELEKLLAGRGFVKPHRSFLVNYRYIFSIDRESLILDDQTEIPMSRRKTEEIKREFLRLSREGA